MDFSFLGDFSVYFQVLISLIIGIGLFIYAIDTLSKSLAKTATDVLKKKLEEASKTPTRGLLTGMFATFIVQSSSITMLTLIGFVNSGLISLERSIGIILGANIGTTITAQIISFKAIYLIIPLLIISTIFFYFFKKESFQRYSVAIFAFALIFLAMEFLKIGVEPLSQDPFFLDLFSKIGDNIWLALLVGFIFTGIVSTSTVTIGVIISLGLAGLINLEAAIGLMLGANLGTCVLSILVAIKADKNSKRVAFVQFTVNFLGILLFLPIISIYQNLVFLSSDDIGRQIANGHTFFNVITSVIFLPFTVFLAKLSKIFIRD